MKKTPEFSQTFSISLPDQSNGYGILRFPVYEATPTHRAHAHMGKTDSEKFFQAQKLCLLMVALLTPFAPLAALAAMPDVLPNAGSVLQQAQRPLPVAAQPTAPVGLLIETTNVTSLPDGAPFLVSTIRIIGNKTFSTATLNALVEDAEGKTLTRVQLNKVAARIKNYYEVKGYPLARSVIPQQIIRAGLVTIQVIESEYENIALDNTSRVASPLLQETLRSLKIGMTIDQKSLDNALLLLSDIPGVVVNATLKPSAVNGTSDLIVSTTATPPLSGSVIADDYGTLHTGRKRLSASVNWNNPLHHGDVLSTNIISSGHGSNYARISYDSLISGSGAHVAGAISSLQYVLGGSLAPLNGHGTAQVESLLVKQPVIRSRDLNVYSQLQFDHLQLDDHIDTGGIKTDRHLAMLTASLSGDARDSLYLNGANTWNAGLTAGRVGFDDLVAKSADAALAKTEGKFVKLSISLTRLQDLGQGNSLSLAYAAQWATANLDSAVKMSVGGPYSVRAYDTGAVSADKGALGSIEFRLKPGQLWGGVWQVTAFADVAHVIINRNPLGAGSNSALLAGVGAGLNWTSPNQFNFRAFLATPLGSEASLLGATRATRGWAELSRGF